MSQFKKGLILTYFNIGLTNVLGIFVTPYIILNLGVVNYGLYSYVVTIFAYLAILDFGLSHTVNRYISVYKINNQKEDERKFLATAFSIGLTLSIVLLIVGVLLVSNLSGFLSGEFDVNMIDKLKLMLSIVVFNIMVAIPGNVFVSIINAYEHFVFTRVLNIISYITRVIILFILLYFDNDPVNLVILDASINISMIFFNYLYVRKRLGIGIEIGFFDKILIRSILVYSFWIFLFNLVNKSQWLVGQFILGRHTDAQTVGFYNIGVMLATFYTAFAFAINEMMLPRAAKTMASKTVSVTNEMIKVSRLLLFVTFAIILCFGLFGLDFIQLWIKIEEVNEIWLTAILLMFSVTFSMLFYYGFSILQVRNKMKIYSLINFLIMYLSFTVGYYLAKDYQIMGVVTALVSGILIKTVYTLFYFQKTISLNLYKYLKVIYIKNLDLILVFIPLGLLLNYLFNEISWFILFLKVSIIILCYIGYLIMMKLEPIEVNKLNDVKNKFLGTIRR